MATATLPESGLETANDSLFEVVFGVVVEKHMSALATLIAFRLASQLDIFTQRHRLGTTVTEMLFILDAAANLRRRPDVAFVTAAQWPVDLLPPANGDWELAPALAIEVASPGNTFSDLLEKIDEYFRTGVQEVWIVSPEKRKIYVYRSPVDVRILSADQTISTDLIPGWSSPVADIVPALPAPSA